MALIQCVKSSILFECEHLPLALSASYAIEHPIFNIPQKKLISLAGQWAAGKLTAKESYLLFLALLDSTSLVVWHKPAQYTPALDKILANNMESLLKIIAKIALITSNTLSLPSFAVSNETSTLMNAGEWITVWHDSYSEWYDAYSIARKQAAMASRLADKEEALQRLIKSSMSADAYADKLADWAAVAGAFPTAETIHPLTQSRLPLDVYWKQIIKSISNDDKFWRYPKKDIQELIDHCEDNISMGNIYSHTLMKYLRSAIIKHSDFFGFSDAPERTSFTILNPAASNDVEAINKAALIQRAPIDEPKKSQYPTTFAWLKAYTQWKLATSSK